MGTKKVKTAGKYGSRYGLGIRRRLLEVEEKKKKKYSCPSCGFARIKRKAKGIFFCKKCGAEFSGGAYYPETLTGAIVKKMVSQKVFLPAMKELIEVTEKTKHPAAEPPKPVHSEPVQENGGKQKGENQEKGGL